jgi:predicted transcriptional regulator
MKKITEYNLDSGFKKLLKSTGYNKSSLEKKAGLGVGTIYRMIESNNATISTLYKIAEATGHKKRGHVSVSALLETMGIR